MNDMDDKEKLIEMFYEDNKNRLLKNLPQLRELEKDIILRLLETYYSFKDELTKLDVIQATIIVTSICSRFAAVILSNVFMQINIKKNDSLEEGINIILDCIGEELRKHIYKEKE
jgi:hypothetical protein